MSENESIPIGSESVEAEEVSEETPVLDVHVPHATHTWKDFFIHIATITVGLLIAVGLEQSVEKLHHLHQRHQLEEDLRVEGVRDDAVVQADLRTFAVLRAWLLGLRDQVDRMRASGGKLKLPYPPKPFLDPDTGKRLPLMTVPSDAAWQTAKESQLVGLLQTPLADVYARFSWQHELLTNSVTAWIANGVEVTGFEDRFDSGPPSTPDLSRMTVGELGEYSVLLSKNLALMDNMVYRLKLFDAQDRAILNGVRTDEDLLRAADLRRLEAEK
jgi:hypothetical protein